MVSAVGMFDDLISAKPAPEKRASFVEAGIEHHLSEAAVMLAFAMHLLRTMPGLKHVDIHPDGEHAKQFDLGGWLAQHGFQKTSSKGSTAYGGIYQAENGHSILINPASGRFDVVADAGDLSVGAECKGGIINTRHSGQVSRVRKGLCEAVGLLMQHPLHEGQRQVAVVPLTPVAERLARQMLPRASKAGIEIALVDGHGNVHEVK
jgi:hypothetical protein